MSEQQAPNTTFPGIINSDGGSRLENDTDLQSPYRSLVNQIREEYNVAYRQQVSRIQLILQRLRLYNNQMRDPGAVGDTLLFTLFNSFFSQIYEDSLSVEFIGRLEGKEEKAAALNNVAKFDYDEMQKAEIDYQWDWDTLFFSHSILGMSLFDRKNLHPVPEIWDPTTMLRDPDAITVNGDAFGNGAARFLGREILLPMHKMEGIPGTFDLDLLKLAKPKQSLIDQARQAREQAQGLSNNYRYEEKGFGTNARYPQVEWFTHWKDNKLTGGKVRKVLVWLGNDLTKVTRFKLLDDYFPLVDRVLFPNSHQWDGVSIPDLVEDKQRLRAIMLNMDVRREKSSLFGMYLIDKDMVKNKDDISFDFDKVVPVKVPEGKTLANAVLPMPKDQVNQMSTVLVSNMLDMAAQRALAISETQMGVPSKGGKKTLGEVEKLDMKATGRQSITAKVFGWSEKDFWEQWYGLYKKHFKPRIDKKIVRINTVFGPKYQPIERDDIIDKDFDPDIEIKSKYLSGIEKNTKRTLMTQWATIAVQTPGVERRYLTQRMGYLNDIPKDEMNRIFPPTPDEIKAERENASLGDGKMMYPDPNDNHVQHLVVHARCKETPELIAHKAAHEQAMELQKSKPELFPQQQQQQQQEAQAQQSMGKSMGKVASRKNTALIPGESSGMTTMLGGSGIQQ